VIVEAIAFLNKVKASEKSPEGENSKKLLKGGEVAKSHSLQKGEHSMGWVGLGRYARD